MNWIFEKNIVTIDTLPDGAVGFIYIITHIPSGRFYIGKKQLNSIRTKKLGKKELLVIKEARKLERKGGRLPTKKKVVSDSDWETYYSSNDKIKEMVMDGKSDEFSREIIRYCFSTKSLSYWEVYYQFKYDVLNNENSYNDNISGKFFRKDIL